LLHNVSSTTNLAVGSSSHTSSSTAPGKKIKRIIYEIGNLLSLVGIGKDLKQTNLSASSSPHSNNVNAMENLNNNLNQSDQISLKNTTATMTNSINIVVPEDSLRE
jgi:hypothetical protein